MSDVDYKDRTSVPDFAPAELAPDPSPPSPAADDAPSQAQDTSGDTRQSLLDAVQSAVPELRRQDRDADDGQGASPAPTAQRDQATSTRVDDDASAEEPTQEELAKYSFSAKKRLSKLEKQRNAARAEVTKLTAEVAQLRAIVPQAQAADSVSTYLKENDIGREDFLHMLDLGASLRRGDIKRFYAGIKPYVDMAEQFLGISLPPDMQNAVRQGQMTTEAAAHFTRERMERAMLENKHLRTSQIAQQQQQHFQQQQEMHRREVLANAVAASVNQWEQAAIAHDPNYAAKRTAVQNTMWAVVREKGSPQSPEHAVEIAREAYRRVNEQYRSWAPPKRPTSRSPSSTGRSTGAAPEAKTLLDVVRQARESASAS